jgi:tetratricopeptide (TPR) repeat protein
MENIPASNALLKAAFAHHREGKLTEAEALYRQALEIDPHQPHALSMLGMILMNGSGKAEAESLFLRHLEVDQDNPLTLHNLGQLLQGKGNDREAVALFRRAVAGKPDLAPIFNDLAVSLHRLGQWDEALVALDRALGIDPYFGVAHDNRGVVLYDCRRFREALEAHQSALTCTPTDATAERISIRLHLARAAYEATELAIAEQACRAILEMDADNAVAIEYLAKTLYRLRRDDEALSLLNRRARNQGLTEERPEHPESTILVLGAVGASHVPTRYLFDPALFATMTLTMVSPDQADAPLGSVSYDELTKADLIFNALGEVEKDGGQIEAVKTLSARLGKPILNPPERVARTGRDRAHELFGNIPGLLVPDVHWRMRDELIGLPTFDVPFLIRPGGAHGGEDLALIQTSSDLTEHLAKVPRNRFLQTDFHDFKGAQDCYRKYRFIFVDRQPLPYHLAIAESWLVHYWRAEMERGEWKKREEQAFLTDWRQVFGPKASAAVEQVAQHMDLDYGGMDCSLLPNGDVLLFEANACMLVHLDDTEADFPYKHQAVSRIRDAMTRMVRDRDRISQAR